MKALDDLRTYFDSLPWWQRYGFPKPLYNALIAPKSTDYDLILAAMSSQRSPLKQLFPGLIGFFKSPEIERYDWFYKNNFFSEGLIRFKEIKFLKRVLEILNERNYLPAAPWSRSQIFIGLLRIDLYSFYADLSKPGALSSTTDLFQLINRHETSLRRTTSRLPRIKASEEEVSTESSSSSVDLETTRRHSPLLMRPY
jgi:hypothetical protein